MAGWSDRLAAKNPWVAEIDDEIVGMAELEEGGFIDYFYVLPEFQQQGVGSALLSRLEVEAERTGIRELVADVSVTARDFFESRGFRIIEARSNMLLGHPAPNFAMSKSLPSGTPEGGSMRAAADEHGGAG